MGKRSLRFGSIEARLPAPTSPPLIPPNLVSPDSTRLTYTVSQLTPLVGAFDRCAVIVRDLNGVQAEWHAGDQTTADGTTVIGNTVAGRWFVLPGGGDGQLFLAGPSVEGVISAVGAFAGETKVCSSRWSDGTGFGFELIWSTTTATVDGVDVLANFPGQGSWRRRRFGIAPAASSTTMRCNGTTDDTAALENTLARIARTAGSNVAPELKFEPTDRIRVTDTIVLDPSTHCPDICFKGGPGRSTYDLATTFLWDGANDRPMFSVRTRGVRFEGLIMAPNTLKDLLVAVDWKINPVNVSTALRMSRCHLGPIGGSAYLQYGVTTDLLGSAPSNLEEAIFDDVATFTLEAGYKLSSGQPYTWRFYSCQFDSGNGALGVPTGRGIWITAPAATVSLFSPTFGLLSTGIAIDQVCGLSISGYVDVERTKRFMGRGDGTLTGNSHNGGRPITIGPGRYAAVNYGVAAANPTIAASEDTYIHVPFALNSLTMYGCTFHEDAEPQPRRKVKTQGYTPITAIGCTFPNTDPFDIPANTLDAPLTVIGCRGRNNIPSSSGGDLYDNLHSISGTKSPDVVSVVVPDGITSIHVPWGKVENFRPSVFVAVSKESGTPSAGSLQATVSNITTRGCDVTLAAATGASASVRVDLHIKPQKTSVGLIGETAFTSGSTVRATAADAGIRNFKWMAVLAHLNAGPTGGQALLSCYAAGGGFIVYGSAGSLRVNRYAGAGNAVGGSYALSGADVGLTHLIVFTQDATTLRTYAKRVQVGSGVAHVAQAAGAGSRFTLGVNNSGTEPTTSDWTLLGVAGSDTGTVPTLADIEAYFDAVLAAKRLVVFPGAITTERLWQPDGGATVEDEVGSDDITLVSGTATATALVVPDFAWVT